MKELMNQYKEILSIKRLSSNGYCVEVDFIDNAYYSKEFKNKEEIIVFMEKEYYQLKCKYLKENIIKLNTKIKNQTISLNELHKAYNKLLKKGEKVD